VRRTAQSAALTLILLAVASGDASSAPPEAGTSTWVLQKGRDIPLLQARKPMLRMEGDKLSGSTGCNNFTAIVSRRAEQRVTIEQVALTRMLCEPKQNTIEKAFVGALRQTEFINRQGSTLTFLSVEKLPLLVWKRQGTASVGKQARRRAAHVRALKRKRMNQRVVMVQRVGCFVFRWR
jgi:heat shock protein HslJ